jgi:hypothetical protein
MEVLVPDIILGKRTILSGKIVSNFGQSTIDCAVRSLSDVGACLQVESNREVPQQFELVMHGGRERKPCRVQWQSDDRIGVSRSSGRGGCEGGKRSGPRAQPDAGAARLAR